VILSAVFHRADAENVQCGSSVVCTGFNSSHDGHLQLGASARQSSGLTETDLAPVQTNHLKAAGVHDSVILAMVRAYASVPTDGSRKTYPTGIVAKQRQNSGSLTKTIDRLEWMREQMLTLQHALERVESDKRERQIQRATTRLKIKQF